MKTTIGRNPQFILLAAFPACLLAACSRSLTDIDRRTDEVVRQRSASLLGATVRPEITGRGLHRPADGDRLTQKHPPSNDPSAGQLTLKPADEARDVAARLAKYGVQADGAVAARPDDRPQAGAADQPRVPPCARGLPAGGDQPAHRASPVGPAVLCEHHRPGDGDGGGR